MRELITRAAIGSLLPVFALAVFLALSSRVSASKNDTQAVTPFQ